MSRASTVIHPHVRQIAYSDRQIPTSLILRPKNPVQNTLELQFKQKRGRRRGHDQVEFDLEILFALGILVPFEQRLGNLAEVCFQGAEFHNPLLVSIGLVSIERMRRLITGVISLGRHLFIAEVEVRFQPQVTGIFDCD